MATKEELEGAIKSGNFSAGQAREYNTLMGQQDRARNIALTSKPAVSSGNLQTAITQQEGQMMKDAGIKTVDKSITLDKTAPIEGPKEIVPTQAPNQGALNGNIEPAKVEPVKTETKADIKPTSTTDITYKEDKVPYDANKVISKAPQFTGVDGKTYQTVRNSDNTLTTIDVTTGQPVTGKYTDAERESIKQGFLKSPEDKQTEDIKSQQDQINRMNKDPKALFQRMVAGESILDPNITNTPEFKRAKSDFDTYNRLRNYTTSQFQSSLSSGELLSTGDMYNALTKDPQVSAKINQAIKLNNINGKTTDLNNAGVNATDKVLSENPTIAQYLEDGNLSADELKQMTTNSETKRLQTKLEEDQREYTDLKAKWDAIETDIDKQLEGTGATSTDKAQMIANARKALLPELTRLETNLNNTYSMYNSAKSEALSLFNTNLGLYKESQARAYETAQLQEQRAYEEQARTKKLEQAYQYQYGDLNSTNPTLQNIAVERAVADMYTKYHIPGMESQAMKVQKVKDRMAQGMSGTEAIKSVEDEIRKSQRYKDYLASEKAKITPQATESWQKLTDGSLYNQATGEIKSVGATGTGATGDLRGLASQYPGQAWAKNNNPAGITWNANFDNPKPGTTAYALQQAGVNFSKGTARPSAEGGNYVTFDTIEDGLLAQQIMMTQTYGNSTVNQMLQKWVGTSEGPNYAKQVAGNAGINLNTKVSDLSQEQLASLQMAKIQKESPGLYKLLNQAQAGEGEGLSGDIDVKVANIGNIAYGKTVSDTESERIQRIIEKYPDKSTYEIALAVRGFDIKDSKNTNEAMRYLGMFNSMTKAPEGFQGVMSNYINKGDWSGLANYTAKHIDNDVKTNTPAEEYISTSSFRTGKESTDTLLNLISKNKDKIGPVAGNVNNLLNKVSNTGDYQKIKTLLQMNQADVRRKFAGSAVTETEMQALVDFIGGKTTMNADNLLTMLKTVQNKTNTEYLNQRQGYGFDFSKYLGLNKGTGNTPTKTPVPPAVKTQIIKTSNGKTYNINF